MKKIFLSVILMVVFGAKGFAADYYLVGVDAYKKGAYDKAASNFEHAIKINSKNVNARYYLAQVYLKQKRVAEAQEQYRRIIFLDSDSDAGILAQKGLSLISQSCNKKVGSSIPLGGSLDAYKDNYLDYVLSSDGKIIKWASFPVSVYIEPSPHKDAVKNAFEQWRTKTNNLVSFTYANSPAQGQIVVVFKDKLEEGEARSHFVAGYSKPYSDGNRMKKSDISLLSKNPETHQDFEEKHYMLTALHEIGHSLGFRGHSPDEKDIMAAVESVEKTELSRRDINTMNIFYRIDDKVLASRNKGKGQTDVQLEQALDYVRSVPDKAVGWVNLGDIYKNKKMYSEAIKNYRKAISLEPNKADAHALLGVAYSESGDNNNAYLSYKKACDLEKTNAFYLYFFCESCLKVGRKDVGKSYLDNYVKANPQGLFDEKVQALLKMYK